MSFNAGAITGTISLNTAPFTNAIRSVRGMLTGLQGMATRVALPISAALGGIGIGTGIKLAADMEQAQVAFEVLIGSAERARQTLRDLTRFAASTPFQLSGLTQTAQTLLNFNVSADQLMPTIDMLSNVAAGNEQRMQSLALAFGQVQSAGRLTGQDLLQFINAGFNPLNEISRRTGESMAQLRKRMESGGIGIDEVRQAFIDATSEGGRFYQMNRRQSQTVLGLFSTLKDSIAEAMRVVGDVIIEKFDLKSVIAQAIDAVNAVIPTLTDLLGSIAAVAEVVGGWAARNRQAIIAVGVLSGVVAGLTAAVIAMKVAVAALLSPVTLTVAALVAVGTAVAASVGEGATLTERLRTGFIKMAKWVVSAGVGAFSAIEVAITRWGETFDLIKASAELSVRGIVGNIVHGLTVNVPEALGWLSRNWRDLFTGILVYTTGVLENLSKNIRAVFTAIWEFIKSGGTSGFSIDWTPLTEGIHVAFREELKLTARELSTREKELAAKVGRLGATLGDEIGSKMKQRTDTALKALGLTDTDSLSTQDQTQEDSKPTASKEDKQSPGLQRVLSDNKLAGLNFINSNEELQLRARQQLAAAGAQPPDTRDLVRKQLDEQQQTNRTLEELASLLRQSLSDGPDMPIVGI